MRSFCKGDDKVNSCLEWMFMKEPLVLDVSGYLELFDFTSRDYHDLI